MSKFNRPVSRRRPWTAVAIAACLLTLSTDGNSQTNPQPTSGDQQKIVDVITSLFAALQNDDFAKFNSIVTPGFYIFDNGLRFDGDSVVKTIQKLQSSGKHFEWSVTEPDVHVEGSVAWIAYVNKGSIITGSLVADQNWLESAFLQKQSGKWRIAFLQSTRAAPTPPAQAK